MARDANTDQGLTVSWQGTPVTLVAGGNGDDNNEMVDCTTLADAARDFRSGLANPTASLNFSLKDSGSNPFTKDDHGTLVIGDDFSETMRISSVSKPIEVGGHAIVTATFASTTEAVT